MSDHPFTAEVRDGILQLWLDTPRCEVNVLSSEAAEHLEALLKDVDRQPVRAVVLRSAKRGSFLNGAQLMLANTIQDAEDVPRATDRIRNAYRAVRALRVPTIAAVQGTCYGCGLEFALHADYRVAERSVDTHFYMTEVPDYLLLPIFGSTQDLPALVGLRSATNLLLWGERWSADRALEHGLVDAVFDQQQFEFQLGEFVAARADAPRRTLSQRSEDIPGLVASTLARIEQLPPDYRPLYSRCFELLVASAVRGPDYDRELQASARSVMRPITKAARAFFFIREVAKAKCRAAPADKGSVRLTLNGLADLGRHIERNRPRDVMVVAASDESALRLVPYGEAGADATGGDIAVALEPIHASIVWRPELIAYAPCYSRGLAFFEVAEREPGVRSAEVVELFSRLGFAAVSTRPRSRFVLNELLVAYFGPLLAFVESGGAPEVVATTLRDFGFVRGPALLAEWLGPRFAPQLAGAELSGQARPALRNAVLVNLLSHVLASRESGSVAHVSLVDLMAREVLDFPLAHTSLCHYLTRQRAELLLDRAEEFAGWVAPEAVERARGYARGGKDFYA